MPARGPSASRVVIGESFLGKAGQYFWTGASRSSWPRSHNCIAPVAVSGFEIDARRNRVCSLAGTLFSTSAKPKPEAHSYWPFSTTATETPGTCVELMNFATAASIWVRLSAESCGCCAAQIPAAEISRLRTPRRKISDDSRHCKRAFRRDETSRLEILIMVFALVEKVTVYCRPNPERLRPRSRKGFCRSAGIAAPPKIADLRLVSLLGHSGLVAYSLPVPIAADPDPGVAIGAAEIFAELVAFDLGPGSNDRRLAVDSHHHVGYVHRFVTQLPALACADSVLFGGYLAEGRSRDVVLGERALGEFGVTLQAGFLRLALEVDDLADRVLLAGRKRRPGMHRDMLGRERGQGHRRQD